MNAYSSVLGAHLPESSLATIDEGDSHKLRDESASKRLPLSPIPTNNLLPPGHQSPTTTLHKPNRLSSASFQGVPARQRNNTGSSSNSSVLNAGGNTTSTISLNDSELFRGAQDALQHLERDVQPPKARGDISSATSVALSQHWRQTAAGAAPLGNTSTRTERIEDANLTGISQLTKTPMPSSRYRPFQQQPKTIAASPSLPDSLSNALFPLGTPRSKSVSFAGLIKSPSREMEQENIQAHVVNQEQSLSTSDPEDDAGLSATAQAQLSEWTRVPPSESSPPSARSLTRNTPQRSFSPIPEPLPIPVEEPRRISPSPPTFHTNAVRTPSRLRNEIAMTDTESSRDSIPALSPSKPPRQEPKWQSPARSPSRHDMSSPDHVPVPPASGSKALLQVQDAELARTSSPATVATSAGAATFATAETFQNTPTSLVNGSRSVPRQPYPSLFGGEFSPTTTEEAGAPEEPEQREAANESVVSQDQIQPASGERSLLRLHRAAEEIDSAANSAFQQLAQGSMDKSHASLADAGEPPQSQQLAYGAHLVQEMQDLHNALQANLTRRLKEAERRRKQEEKSKIQLQSDVRKLLTGLVGDYADDGDVESHSIPVLLAKFRSWAAQMNATRAEADASKRSATPEKVTELANGQVQALQAEILQLQSDLDVVIEAVEAADAQVLELAAERDELRDEQAVFEVELANARRDRDFIAEEVEELQTKVTQLETQVAEETAARGQADAYRRRLEAEFEGREKLMEEQALLMQQELEQLQDTNAAMQEQETRRLEAEFEEREKRMEKQAQAMQQELERLQGANAALQEQEKLRRERLEQVVTEREAEVDKLLAELATERKKSSDLLEESTRQSICSRDTAEEADRLGRQVETAEAKVLAQAARIRELEMQSANADLEIAKLLKVRDRMEQENDHYAMALRAKQQELSLLKRNGPRPSGHTTFANGASTQLEAKTPKASDRHRQAASDAEVGPLSTVRKRPPTAVLESLILNTETPLPSSRIANRMTATSKNLHKLTSDEDETGDEVTPLRKDPRLEMRGVLGERKQLGARVGTQPSTTRPARATNNENEPPSSAVRRTTATMASRTGSTQRPRASTGSAISSTIGAERMSTSAVPTASTPFSRDRAHPSVGSSARTSNVNDAQGRARIGTRPVSPALSTSSRASSVRSGVSAANSRASSASTRTGTLRSAAGIARKSSAGGGSSASTVQQRRPSMATGERISGMGARPSLKRSSPDGETRPARSGLTSGRLAPTTGSRVDSASTGRNVVTPSAASSTRSTIVPLSSTVVVPLSSTVGPLSSTVMPPPPSRSGHGGAGASNLSMSLNNASLGSSVRDEEMTEEELSSSLNGVVQARRQTTLGVGSTMGANRRLSGFPTSHRPSYGAPAPRMVST
ncbi:hypothetical protein OC861_001177 [Tilletia horrida]|nr:hypothetical protein OC861_001177 [Tilletia horrida]